MITRLFFLFALLLQTLNADTIRLHPQNPHYFLFRGEAVALISSGEHYGAVLNADFDYHRYLSILEAVGLNYTRLFGGIYIEVPGKSFGILRNDLAPLPGRYVAPWARSETPGYAGGGMKFDLERWNPEYFARYRDFLSEAAKRGIVVEITLFSSHYDEAQWNISALNPANNVNSTDAVDWRKIHTLENGNELKFQELYVRKLVQEADDFDNVIFEIQNEPWSDRPTPAGIINPYLWPPGRDTFPNSVEAADALSLAWQGRVLNWITSEEASLPNKHLVAQNYCNFYSSVRELLPGVSIINFHYAYPQAVLANYGLGKALSYDETGFLGHDDAPYLRQAWNFMLTGGSVFNHLDYSFNPGHEDGSDTAPNGPGGGSAVLRHQLRILSDFLRSFSLVDLRPDSQTIQHASGVIPHGLSDTKGHFAFYFDGKGPTKVNFKLLAGDYSAEWINVLTGETTQRETFSHHGGGEKHLVSPAFKQGIALRLVRTNR
jgi:hypothetical protein